MKRLLWLWPAIIILSTVAAGLATFVITGTAVRPFIVLWFLFVCPGMALLRFFRLEERLVEWILALAMSFAIDAIVAGAVLYAGRWSPTTIIEIVMGISLAGAILQIGLDPLIKLIGRTRVSSALDYNDDLEKTQILMCMCGFVDDRPIGRFCSHCGKPKSKRVRPAPIPTSIQPLLDASLHALEPLSSHFYGIYIFGSIALGAFEEQKSDIDIVALTQGEWTRQKLAQLKHIHKRLTHAYPLGKRLEILYIPLQDIGKTDSEIAPYPYCGRKGEFHSAGYYDLQALIWWIIRYKSICLFGPERSALPLEVTWKDVLKGIHYYLDIYLVDKARHPYLFLLDGWVWEVVPMLCRVLTTLEDSEICAKPLALKRWRDRLPARWHLLIDEGWRIGYHPHTPSLYRSPVRRMREVLAFIEYIRERGAKALEASSMITPSGKEM